MSDTLDAVQMAPPPPPPPPAKTERQTGHVCAQLIRSVNQTPTAACCPIALPPAIATEVRAVGSVHRTASSQHVMAPESAVAAADENGGGGSGADSWNCTCASGDEGLQKEEHAALRDGSCFTSCNCTSGTGTRCIISCLTVQGFRYIESPLDDAWIWCY